MKPLDPARRALLDAANRERTPDAETRARVLASVLALGASGAAASAKAASVAGSTVKASTVKGGLGIAHWWVLGGLGVVGLSSLYLVIRHAPPAPEARPTAIAASSAPASPGASLSTPAGSASADPPAPDLAASAAPEAGKAPASAGSSRSPASADALERELSLLQSAHSAYRAGQPSKALQLAREHAQLYPRSQLAAERQTIEVLSLCALGRTREARVAAANLRAASGSPSLAGLDASCVGK